MKKKLLTLGFVSAMLVSCLTGCGKKEDKKLTTEFGKTEETTTEATTEEETTTEEEVVDYATAYEDILRQYVDLIYCYDSDYPIMDGEYGVTEFAMMVGKKEAIQQIGYITMDITGDDVPELIIGTVDSPADNKGNIVFAVYAMVDGTPKLCVDGYYRNFYAIMEDGHIYNSASSGAAYSGFSLYRLGDDGELICEHCYFTHEVDEDFNEIHLFYNTTGVWDVNESSEVVGDESDVYAFIESWKNQIMDIDFIPLAQIANSNGYDFDSIEEPAGDVESDTVVELVSADELYADGGYEVWTLEDSEWTVELGIRINNTVTDFSFVLLDLNDSSTFNCTYIENLGVVNSSRPLIVGVTFPGDIPRYGFTFVDVDGRTRRFAIGQSGEDGSYYLSEFF